MKRNRRVSKFLKEEDTDPLSVVVNLFDVAMVFAVIWKEIAAVFMITRKKMSIYED